MTLLNKPIYTPDDVWGNQGAKTLPPADKIKTGWGQEMMPAEYENWIQNRQDHAIAYLYQRGIPEWDSLTPYYKDKSIVQLNGNLYIAAQDNTNTSPSANAAMWTVLVDKDRQVVTRTGPTGAANIPTGTTAQRPVTVNVGMLRYSSTLGTMEFRNGTDWVSVIDSSLLTTARTITGQWTFNGAVPGGTGLRFGPANHLLRNNTTDGATEVVNASGALFGQRPDGTFYAKYPDGTEQHFYTDKNLLPLVSSFGLSKPASAASQTIDPQVASVFEIVLTSVNTDFTVLGTIAPTPQARQLTLMLTQDAVGARLVTWPANIKWASGRTPVLSYLPNRTDCISLLSTDNGNTWYGFYNGGFFISQ